MIKEEHGISTIKLIFTIIILAVVITATVFIVKGLWNHSNVKDVETDLLYIKAKCKIIHDKNIIDKNEQLLGENIVEYSENEEVNDIISQSDKWYKLAQQDLQSMGLEDLKDEDGYLVNYEEQDIIYAKGIERYKQTYYKLSDLEKADEEEEKRKQEEEKEKQEEEKNKENADKDKEETEQQTQDEATNEQNEEKEVTASAQIPIEAEQTSAEAEQVAEGEEPTSDVPET